MDTATQDRKAHASDAAGIGEHGDANDIIDAVRQSLDAFGKERFTKAFYFASELIAKGFTPDDHQVRCSNGRWISIVPTLEHPTQVQRAAFLRDLRCAQGNPVYEVRELFVGPSRPLTLNDGKNVMPARCTSQQGCRAHGCHGACLPAEGQAVLGTSEHLAEVYSLAFAGARSWDSHGKALQAVFALGLTSAKSGHPDARINEQEGVDA